MALDDDMTQPSLLRRLLCEKETLHLDVDGADRMAAHRAVLDRKPMIRHVFEEFHRECLRLDAELFGDTPGLRVELGAGVCPIRRTDPDVLATDVVPADDLDRVLDAQAMDLPDGSVRALYGQNCFHHFPDPAVFLAEATRVLHPGGGAILIEPYHGPLARLLYKRLFASEGFDMSAPGWITAVDGPMHGANQALSYNVFRRDHERFERDFPALRLVHARPLPNALRYFLSGGLNFKSLVPRVLDGPLRAVEGALRPLSRLTALHHVLVLQKTGRPGP